jgi:hypothetical protein
MFTPGLEKVCTCLPQAGKLAKKGLRQFLAHHHKKLAWMHQVGQCNFAPTSSIVRHSITNNLTFKARARDPLICTGIRPSRYTARASRVVLMAGVQRSFPSFLHCLAHASGFFRTRCPPTVPLYRSAT